MVMREVLCGITGPLQYDKGGGRALTVELIRGIFGLIKEVRRINTPGYFYV